MLWRAAILGVLLVGCGDDDTVPPDAGADAGTADDAGAPDAGPEDAGPEAIEDHCDPLVPTVCALPFPSTYYEAEDPSTASGRRLAVPERALPATRSGMRRPAPDVFEGIDGWSPSTGPIAHFPRATLEGVARSVSIARSLEDDSPTVIVDALTGERIPHFADIDVTTDNDAQRAFLLRPVVPLAFDREYWIAIRGLRDEDGATLPPSPAFVALRDGGDFPHPSIDARRDEYEALFVDLDDAGVARDELQLAWRFHTRSRESCTAGLLRVRELALAAVGDDGPSYRIVSDERDVNENVAREIEGVMEVPLFLDEPGPGGTLFRDDDGQVAQNGTAEFPFRVLVPPSATPETPAAITQFGHGLFGTRGQVDGHREFGQRHGHVLFGVDWIGMSEEDFPLIGELIVEGAAERFQFVPHRLHQAFVNSLLAMRLVSGRFAEEELQQDGEPIVDPRERYYFGESQGGIFGATYMAISTDVTRGGLRVPGQPYSLLLSRSVDFDGYFALLRIAYRDGIDVQLLVALAQILYDTVEPGTWSRFVEGGLEGTPEHRVLMHAAIGDHQVTTLGAHLMARAVGAPLATPAVRSAWGVDERAMPFEGSALVEFDFGLPPDPVGNEPQREGDDPHGDVKNLDAARAQLDHFLRTGEVAAYCDGPCDPE